MQCIRINGYIPEEDKFYWKTQQDIRKKKQKTMKNMKNKLMCSHDKTPDICYAVDVLIWRRIDMRASKLWSYESCISTVFSFRRKYYLAKHDSSIMSSALL